jgi:hypothetical protein
MTTTEERRRGLHGVAGGSENALEEGVWGRNLLKVSLPLARPSQALTHKPDTHHTKIQPGTRFSYDALALK